MSLVRQTLAAALKYLGDKADLRSRAERALSLDPQEQDLADIAVETGASFIPGVGPALAARDFERARRADDEVGMGLAAASAVPGGRLAGLLKRYDPTRLELDVYHGTPHRFEPTENNPLGEFDASKIGTGEGAQAYGRGIYLTESPEVGRQYQQFLAARKNDLSNPENMAASIMYRTPQGTREAGIGQIDRVFRAMKVYPRQYPDMEEQRAVLQKARDLLESGAELPAQGGSFYKVDLPDEMIDRMLDYDKPINEHSQNVLDALEKAGINTQSAMRAGQMIEGQEAHLAKFGIPGIYHRGQGGADVRTFVVFPGEEKKVRILERDGQKAPAQKIAQALEATAQKTTAVEVPDVLHGSPMRGLTNLSPSKSMEVRGATWFSDNPDVADQYTFPREYGEILYDAEPGEVYKAGLSFKNPMTVDMEGRVGDATELSKLVKKAKEEGYDGLILRNVDDSVDSSKLLGTSYAVFDPSQIKLKKK